MFTLAHLSDWHTTSLEGLRLRDGVLEVLSVPGGSAGSETARQEAGASPANDRFERAAALRTLAGTGNLRADFNADKDKARLMVALSPT